MIPSSVLGPTKGKCYESHRAQESSRLLERGEERLDVVARAGGLATATNLRARLRRRTGLTPTEYRRRFTLTH
ncbi:helix-turn-helix domain-containing protein [Streptomyces atratus]